MVLVVFSSVYSPLYLFSCDAFNTIVSTDAGIKSRTFAVFALTVRAFSKPHLTHTIGCISSTLGSSHPRLVTSHPHYAVSHPHQAASNPH